jgi:hypothetical protein
MASTSQIVVLDPTEHPVPKHTVLAPRPDTLDGATVGLLANGKHNSEELLEMIGEVLADHYEFAAVVPKNKGNASRPCPEDILRELAEQCDVVVTASGD